MIDQKKQATKVKMTILLDKSLKKFAQLYALQNDMTLQDLVALALEHEILDRDSKK